MRCQFDFSFLIELITVQIQKHVIHSLCVYPHIICWECVAVFYANWKGLQLMAVCFRIILLLDEISRGIGGKL